jgi:arylsulfatase A-like enzyme
LTAGSRALLVTAGVAVFAGCGERHSSTPQRVVIVSIDTLRPDHLGCYGYARPTSPEIDRFRRDAVLLRSAIAQVPSTLASHASLFTSLRPQHHGASVAASSRLKPGVRTLAEVLRTAGFATASFNGGGQLHRSWGLDRGFDTYVSATDSSTAEIGEDTLSGQVARGTAWLDRIGRRPFLLFLHTYEVHHPYTPAPERLRQMESGYSGNLPDRISIRLLEKINAGQRRLGPADLAHIEAAYDAEIASADAGFGELVRWLRERGLYDSTLVVLTSDHGEAFGERGRVGWHGDALYDEQIRIPLIVKLPGGRLAGTSIESQVREIDLAPTVLSELGLPIPAEFSGSAIDLAGGAADHPPWAVATIDGNPRSQTIRTLRWKWYDGHLYDLERDPRENHDLERGHRDLESDLENRLAAILHSRELVPLTAAEPPEDVRKELGATGLRVGTGALTPALGRNARRAQRAGTTSNLRGFGSASSLRARWSTSSRAARASAVAFSAGSFSAATRSRRRRSCRSCPSPVDQATEYACHRIGVL